MHPRGLYPPRSNIGRRDKISRIPITKRLGDLQSVQPKASSAEVVARAGTREVVHQDYIKFARAKGLSARRVIFVHLMKNILIPVVTVLGLEFGGLIAFSVVTETVFAWPGMGKLIIDSIQNLDRPVIVAYLMIIVLVFVIINLMVDVLYSILDPRVRLQDVKA